jgi:hypothetical protein
MALGFFQQQASDEVGSDNFGGASEEGWGEGWGGVDGFWGGCVSKC